MSHYTEENFNLTQSVGFAINKARNLLVAEIDAALKEFDLTSQQMGILLSLRDGVATTPFELARLLAIDTGLMTRMLDKLEAKGCIERSRSSLDRRVVNLLLLQKGRELAASIPRVVPQVLNARLSAFTEDEFVELRRLLDKFIGE